MSAQTRNTIVIGGIQVPLIRVATDSPPSGVAGAILAEVRQCQRVIVEATPHGCDRLLDALALAARIARQDGTGMVWCAAVVKTAARARHAPSVPVFRLDVRLTVPPKEKTP